MKTLEEKNFEMMVKFALTSSEMLKIRGGGEDEGGEGGEGGDDSDPEYPPTGVKF